MADGGRSLPIFVVDAFTNKPFGGNPAAVCLVGSNVSYRCYHIRVIVLDLVYDESAHLNSLRTRVRQTSCLLYSVGVRTRYMCGIRD